MQKPVLESEKKRCSFEGCNKKATAKRLCSGHYKQLKRGKSLYPLGTFIPDNRGEANPNYRHGRNVNPTCLCGRPKDSRSKHCAICAHVGCPKTGEKRHTEKELIQATAENDTILKIAKRLGVTRTIVSLEIKRLGLDISHFRYGRGRPYPEQELFKAGHKQRIGQVRKRFKNGKYTEFVCASCGGPPLWRGAALTLELDHINGDPTDNRISNLRWLCPNCHSQQPTTRGRNRRKRESK